MRMKVYFGNYILRGYLRLGLCVALGNSIHSDLNSYAVLTVLCRPHNLRILQHKEDNYSDNHTVILTDLIFPAKQFTQLFAVRFIRFLRDHRDSRLFPVRFMRFVLFLFL